MRITQKILKAFKLKDKTISNNCRQESIDTNEPNPNIHRLHTEKALLKKETISQGDLEVFMKSCNAWLDHEDEMKQYEDE